MKLLTQETAVNKNIFIKKNLLYTVVGRDRKEAKENQLWMNGNGCNTQSCSPKAIYSSHRITTPAREPPLLSLKLST